MDSKLFSIGDIVTVNTHPYFSGLTQVVIGGDALSIPPLLIVKEVFKTKVQEFGTDKKVDFYKYICTWYSTKHGDFKDVQLLEDELKLIQKSVSIINKNILKRGSKVVLKSFAIELAKRKSSLSYEEKSTDSGMESKVINPLLSFMPPVLQLSDIVPHLTKKSTLKTDTKEKIRDVHRWDAKCIYFNPIESKISQVVLPLESLEFLSYVDEATLGLLQNTIEKSHNLVVNMANEKTLLKPKHLVYRGGKYYCSGFDYILNQEREVEIADEASFEVIISPFEKQAPLFDISQSVLAASPEFIMKEIIDLVIEAGKRKAFIRIKYKNKNDVISHRAIKNYEIIRVAENGKDDVSYLIGYCLRKRASRTFRIDRIQNVQELILSYAG